MTNENLSSGAVPTVNALQSIISHLLSDVTKEQIIEAISAEELESIGGEESAGIIASFLQQNGGGVKIGVAKS